MRLAVNYISQVFPMKVFTLTRFFICAVALFFLGIESAFAQVADYEYSVYKQNKAKKDDQARLIPIRLGHYIDYKEAQNNYSELVKEKDEGGFNMTPLFNKFSIQSFPGGTTSFTGANGMGIIIVADGDLIFLKHQDGNGRFDGSTYQGLKFLCTVTKLGQGRYSYSVVINTEQLLDETIALGKASAGGNRSRSFNFNDGYEHFGFTLKLPTGTHEEDSRIILLPYVIDCQTEDTIDYLQPAVYEGKKYHALQDKRKGFSYDRHDPLGKNRISIKPHTQRDTTQHLVTEQIPERDENNRTIYLGDDSLGNPIYKMKTVTYMKIDSIVVKEWNDTTMGHGFICPIEALPRQDDEIIIDTIIDYKKPDKNATYHCFLRISMEDYHHQYYEKNEPGTCLRINPFKFLQMSTAAVDIPLSHDFYENAAETPIDVKKELKIQFVYGKSEVIEDSVYDVQVSDLTNEMNEVIAKGGFLTKAQIVGYASPDGPEKVNMDLATRRANEAKKRLRVPGNTRFEIKAVIDTWDHTAELLQERQNFVEAEFVREVLNRTNNNSQAAFAEIKRHPSYVDVIKPVLAAQCRMEFTYSYMDKKVMTSKEAINAYFSDKRKAYSNGDYYNMFSELVERKDSVELDTLTVIAYDRVIKKGKMIDRPLSSYIINRKAIVGIMSGRPDSTILKPLIYETGRRFQLNYRKTDPTGILNDILCNRPEVILNQAVIFYMLQEPERARWYVDMLQRNGYNSPELTRLLSYINFQKIYQIPADQRSPAEQIAFEQALNFVENSSPDNKAVLYTEFEGLGKQSIAMEYVLKMKDSNPVKWYLMGLLWAKRDGRESDYPLNEFEYVGDRGSNPLMTEQQKENLLANNPARYAEQLKIEEEYLAAHPNAKPATAQSGIDMSVKIDGYPYYIAYFHRSMELDPSFAKHYFNEGNIDETMRKKRLHAYKQSRIPAYRKIFALRKIEDDKECARYEELNKRVQEKTTNQQDQIGNAINQNNGEQSVNDSEENKSSENATHEAAASSNSFENASSQNNNSVNNVQAN